MANLLFMRNWRLACVNVCVRMFDPLELELRTGVSHHVGAGE